MINTCRTTTSCSWIYFAETCTQTGAHEELISSIGKPEIPTPMVSAGKLPERYSLPGRCDQVFDTKKIPSAPVVFRTTKGYQSSRRWY